MEENTSVEKYLKIIINKGLELIVVGTIQSVGKEESDNKLESELGGNKFGVTMEELIKDEVGIDNSSRESPLSSPTTGVEDT
ncbi:unnamed protein product [Cuscuta campestris]|uniref:Uncharacterized protein n=1 Tax=Cuscuta campestris TaxID=132261 RepID=A0A484NQU8_9ASTE|nr:unnamed protein product [Cuscuta campestris]